MNPKQCIPMTPELLARITEAFTNPFVYKAQELDLTEWCKDMRADLLDDLPLGPLAYTATTSDYWASYVYDRISDDDCERIDHIIEQLEAGPDEDTAARLQQAWADIESAYEPTPDERPDVWLPRHSCHYFLRTQGALAVTLFPEREWYAVSNERHTFMMDSAGNVFDLLLHDSFCPKYHYTDRGANVLAINAQEEVA